MLPDSQFNIKRTAQSGLQSRCRECCCEYQRLHKQRLEPEAADVAGGEPDVDPASEEPPVKRPEMEAEHLYSMAVS